MCDQGLGIVCGVDHRRNDTPGTHVQSLRDQRRLVRGEPHERLAARVKDAAHCFRGHRRQQPVLGIHDADVKPLADDEPEGRRRIKHQPCRADSFASGSAHSECARPPVHHG